MPMFIDPRFKTIERQNDYLEHHHIFLQDGEDGKVNAELEVRIETLEPEPFSPSKIVSFLELRNSMKLELQQLSD